MLLSLLPGRGGLSAAQRSSLEALTRDARPTLVSIYGEAEGIRVAGTGASLELEGADLALPLILERVMGGRTRTQNP
jgi:hypothetical protein